MEDPLGTKSNALGVASTEVTFDRNVPVRVQENCVERACFDAGAATRAQVFFDYSSRFGIMYNCANGTGRHARGIGALGTNEGAADGRFPANDANTGLLRVKFPFMPEGASQLASATTHTGFDGRDLNQRDPFCRKLTPKL
jgi:hypothetical protein